MTSLQEETFICLDCETTGLDSEKDKIIEIAVVKFTMETTLGEFESLIDPECAIPEESIAIHNITPDMLVGKPRISSVISQLLELIGNHTIVGHGVDFDISLVLKAAENAGIPHTLKKNPVLDTLRLARLYGESPTNSLEQLRKHFNIPHEGAHRAMNDVIVNIAVFKYLAKRYKSLKQICEVLSRPIQLKCMPLGKHKGRPLKEIPIEYLRWAAHKDFDQDLMYSLRSELKRRKQGNHFAQSANPFANL